MAGVALRAARAEDSPAVAEIFIAARRRMSYLPSLHTDEETAEFFAGVVRTSLVEVAERDGRLIGFAAVKGSWLDHLYVRPHDQGEGVGSELLAWVREVSPGAVDLWVFQENVGARRFYARHGFVDLLLTDGTDNEEKQPDAHMRWERDG